MNKELAKMIGDNIAKFRQQKGMTRRELENKIGVAFNTLAAYETGRSFPAVEKIVAISKVLDVDVGMIFGEESLFEYRLNRALEIIRYGTRWTPLIDGNRIIFISASSWERQEDGTLKEVVPPLISFKTKQEFVSVVENAVEASIQSKNFFEQSFCDIINYNAR